MYSDYNNDEGKEVEEYLNSLEGLDLDAIINGLQDQQSVFYMGHKNNKQRPPKKVKGETNNRILQLADKYNLPYHYISEEFIVDDDVKDIEGKGL